METELHNARSLARRLVRLGLRRCDIERLADDGLVPCARIGRRRVFSAAAVEAALGRLASGGGELETVQIGPLGRSPSWWHELLSRLAERGATSAELEPLRRNLGDVLALSEEAERPKEPPADTLVVPACRRLIDFGSHGVRAMLRGPINFAEHAGAEWLARCPHCRMIHRHGPGVGWRLADCGRGSYWLGAPTTEAPSRIWCTRPTCECGGRGTDGAALDAMLSTLRLMRREEGGRA